TPPADTTPEAGAARPLPEPRRAGDNGQNPVRAYGRRPRDSAAASSRARAGTAAVLHAGRGRQERLKELVQEPAIRGTSTRQRPGPASGDRAVPAPGPR